VPISGGAAVGVNAQRPQRVSARMNDVEEAVVVSREREREPHPDPAIEMQLPEILDLRASIDRRTALIEQYREEIADLFQSGGWGGR
jgi:hypothetical protein